MTSSENAPAIRTRRLKKVYSGPFSKTQQTALDGIDLTIKRGTIFGLIGENGAGKTTFIKAILGIIHPSGGNIALFGRPPTDPEVRKKLGYLPERLELPRDWTPRMFLGSVARLRGLSDPRTEIERQLSRVDLTSDQNRKVGGFSKGMRQRLGLAAALLGAPELLVLDEPTDGIDPLHRMEVRKILLEEFRRGATILLNSHLLSETEKICQRIGILHRGRLLKEETLETLTAWGPGWLVRTTPDVPAETLEAMGLQKAEADWRLDVPSIAALNEKIDALRKAGIPIVEVQRNVPSLEDVLARLVEEAQ